MKVIALFLLFIGYFSNEVFAKEVLIIGANPKVLAQLTAELKNRGFAVESFADYENTELIKQTYPTQKFDVVAFGRALSAEQKTALENHFRKLNPMVAFVNGMAPIIHLLADQVELAASPVTTVTETNIISEEFFVMHLPEADSVVVTFYQLNWMYHTYEKVLHNGEVVGTNLFKFFFPKKSGQRFVSVRENGKIVFVEKLVD